MKTNNRKMATWGDMSFCLEFDKEGTLLPTLEANELLVTMKKDIGCLALRAAVKLSIDSDDAKQEIYGVVLTLLSQWNPAKSNWTSHFRSNAYRRLINNVLVWRSGLRSREVVDSILLEEIYG